MNEAKTDDVREATESRIETFVRTSLKDSQQVLSQIFWQASLLKTIDHVGQLRSERVDILSTEVGEF